MQNSCNFLIYNIGQLLTVSGASSIPKVAHEMDDVGIIHDGAVALKNGMIYDVGTTRELKKKYHGNHPQSLDARGNVVLPGFVDCHTHAVFGGDRSGEFVQRLQGSTYREILKKGGGIIRTVQNTRALSAHKLANISKKHLNAMLLHGTTTVEVKSGYGLDGKNEMKILKAIQLLQKTHPIDIVPTFLGAHVLPPEYRKTPKAYVDLVCEMLPKAKPFAKYCDVFCDDGAFSVKQSEIILKRALSLGFQLKIHTNQFKDIGGVSLALKLGCVSIDHLDMIQQDDIRHIKKNNTLCVLLPGVPFFLMSKVYAPAKKMIESGLPVALATDFNPGTCPGYNMQLILTLACLNMNMTPAQTINAATINAAHALGLAQKLGSIEVGKQADLIILNLKDYNQLPYYFGVNHVRVVIKKGTIIVDTMQQTDFP
ncbi:MAG: imidazolonepropionase [Candidatus Brocadiaceae bacterium]|nr:imidazolonepropionase [Candidatus Brocadiaceae bacterium]